MFAKLELFQHTGTFKARGALLNVMELDAQSLERGVTAVSAGNHAIAIAYAAQKTGSSAKVVMTASANPYRIERCHEYGCEIVFADTIHEAFAEVEVIRDAEQRNFVHPFNGSKTILGTATLGREIFLQIPAVEVVVVPIGGGGLCAGVAAALKLSNPQCRVIGVEPAGANSMSLSLAAGRPVQLDAVDTIADSLGAPMALEYSFNMCQKYLDDVVTVSDDELVAAMRTVFDDFKLAVEPACAASTAAILGPLREQCLGKRVVAVFCGSNIDFQTYQRLLNGRGAGIH